jgi:iron complex outermembrane receptor protein
MKRFVSAKHLTTLFMGATALSALALTGTSAVAQQTPAAGQENGVETVVVTARARSEDIQKVPAQVTAFTAETIEAKGINTPADFLDAVPNVTFVATQNAGTSFIVMRGISQARNSEPSAAIVVDGVPMTQPAEFNQELLDLQQIEVLKGPQGGLYGRNAIGGAILITTKQPTDDWEGRFTAGYDDGPGYKFQGVVSGPITDTLKVRVAGSYWNTQGWLTNEDTTDFSARHNADPIRDFNGRVSFLWTPTTNFTADLRLSTDLLDTRGLYYIVPDFVVPDGSGGLKPNPRFNDPDFTSRPIDLNNSGQDDRKIYDAALKLNYDTGAGMLTSISGYSTVWEILTGDGYAFDPFGKSRLSPPFDFNQSQFLTAQTFSQEVRFTSPSDSRFRYIIGGEIFSTDRFISTGNMCDTDDSGVTPEYHNPTPYCFSTFPFVPHGQISFLADSQKQFAWAGYIDTSTDITDDLELSLNIRYDNDNRRNTTETPQFYLNIANIPASTGDQRQHTWSAFQPQAILKYQWTDNLSVYGDYSRGFRSGGFNQTGVATAAKAAGFDNVGDLFNDETADTFEAGIKSRWLDDRLIVNGSVYHTIDHNDYYFVFLASNSTQNLGNIKRVRFNGLDLDATLRVDEYLNLNAGFGLTDSRIEAFPGASSALVVGSKAPLVSDYTFDLAAQYQRPVMDGWDALVRVDYNLIGPTTFVIPVPAVGEPHPQERNPVDLVNIRGGLQSEDWSLMLWSKNLFDKKYNTEYSTGGFLFKADPRSFGVEVTKRF